MEHGRARTALLAELRSRIGQAERGRRKQAAALPFGAPLIDRRLPEGGLALGALHEVAGAGPDVEHGAAAALLVAGVLSRLRGRVLWVMQQRDLFAPALAHAGLGPERVIYVEAGKPAAILLAMEEGLRHRGLAAVVGELAGRITLTASRRLQLAAESTGVIGVALRRSRRHDDPALAEPNAAVTRWRIETLPSRPPLAHATDTPGLGPPRWRLALVRCRGGEAASWIVEADNATGGFSVVADLADRPAAQDPPGHEPPEHEPWRAAG